VAGRATQDAQRTPDHVLGYPDARGLPQLRVALAGYLARARGATVTPGRIVVCAGFMRQVPHARVTGIAAGLHALVQLAAPDSEDDVIVRAARHGLAVDGLGHYRAAGQYAPALVIGYARPPEHAFTTALARLAAVLAGAPA
jgi:DNA-binding transcriptional MocR family regulator